MKVANTISLLAFACFLNCFSARAALAGGTAQGNFQHVVLVVLENTSYSDAITQPFLSSLAKRGAVFSNFHAESHPSQGNYIAMIAGSTLGVHSDANVTLPGTHIGDLLEAKGLTWRTYAEDYPGNCYLGAATGLYARKHSPFISFANIQKSPARCARITDAKNFMSDWSQNKLANFVFYVPNMNNDGHDTDVGYADVWLQKNFAPLLDTPNMKDTLVIFTFDESEGDSPDNQIYTAFVGANVKPGAASSKLYSHYNMLKTIETALGLNSINIEDTQASPIDDIWQ